MEQPCILKDPNLLLYDLIRKSQNNISCRVDKMPEEVKDLCQRYQDMISEYVVITIPHKKHQIDSVLFITVHYAARIMNCKL